MHPVFFAIKRVHLRVVAITRGLLLDSGLTPARFDMMRIVALHQPWGITQSKLRVVLGVSAPTVSRMLRSLELLGHVVRSRDCRDGRDVRVKMTEVGRERIEDVLHSLIESGIADRMAARGLDFDREAAAQKLTVLQRTLAYMRWVFADEAPFWHPWRIDPLPWRRTTHAYPTSTLYTSLAM